MTETTENDLDAKAAALAARWQERTRERLLEAARSIPPVEVPLPGGVAVLATRVPLLTLLGAGRVPDALTPLVHDLLRTGADGGEAAATAQIEARWGEFVRLLDAVWLACVVAPRFSASPAPAQPDAVPLASVDVNDKLALFNWAQGVDAYLDAFRGPGAAARAPRDGEGVRDPSGPDLRGGPAAGAVAGPPAPAGDLPRRARGRGAPAGDAAGADAPAGTAAEGDDVERGTVVVVSPGGRDRPAAAGARRIRLHGAAARA